MDLREYKSWVIEFLSSFLRRTKLWVLVVDYKVMQKAEKQLMQQVEWICNNGLKSFSLSRPQLVADLGKIAIM